MRWQLVAQHGDLQSLRLFWYQSQDRRGYAGVPTLQIRDDYFDFSQGVTQMISLEFLVSANSEEGEEVGRSKLKS
jgi:hypothetical protein